MREKIYRRQLLLLPALGHAGLHDGLANFEGDGVIYEA